MNGALCDGRYIVHDNLGVYTRDGVRLATDLYLPTSHCAPGRWPAVVERTPYDRDRPAIIEAAREATRRGYAFVAQDVRGRGLSGGTFQLYASTNGCDEGTDGADTLAWVFYQPWCDGHIATVGGSFSAANQQAAALHHPPGLRVQFQRDGGINYRRRGLRTHGAFTWGLAVPWAIMMASTSKETANDPAAAAALQQMQHDVVAWLPDGRLARCRSPLHRVPDVEDLLFRMYETGDDTPFWQATPARLEGHWDEYPTNVAVLMVSGWYAHHVSGNFEKLRELGTRLRRPVSLIVGPWVHGPGMLEDTVAGNAPVEFGSAAAKFGPATDTCFAWLDQHLPEETARATTLHPALRYFLMGTGDGHRTPEGRLFHGGEWRTAVEWPLSGTRFVPYYFLRGGGLSTKEPADDGSSSAYDFDPAAPCPTIGSTNLQAIGSTNQQDRSGAGGPLLIGPQDQTAPAGFLGLRTAGGPLAERPDVVTFQSEPLAEPIEVTGPVEVVLWCSSSAPDTDFVAKLIDAYPPGIGYPDGYSMLLCEDIVRMRYRDNQPTAEFIEPGRVYTVRIPLGPTSNLFKAGHRIRVDITSSSFPEYDVNPNTGEPLGRHTHIEVAHQRIYHTASMGSHAVLPLQPTDDQHLAKDRT
ncbi:MAG: CocE/NonD family hydrolase [Actinomycetota bacterium]|nr:CocE/NonD family hydrolase [Actinomycetota bacterium]